MTHLSVATIRQYTIILSAALTLWSLPGYAGDLIPWSGKNTAVSSTREGPQQTRFQSKEGYFETYLFMFYAKGGTWIQTRFILTNVGPGDGHGAVDIMRKGPALDGTKGRKFTRYIDKVESRVRTLSDGTTPLSLKFRETTLEKTKSGYRLRLKAKGYEFEADLRSIGPNWQPGNGEVKLPSGGRFGVHLMPTLAVFKGRERINGKEWRPLKGTGWGEHGYTNVMAHTLSDRFLRFHARKGRYAISFLELFTPAHFGNERSGYLVITKGRKVLASSLTARSTLVSQKTDRLKPHHKLPVEYVIAGETSTGEHISVRVNVAGALAREDVLSTVPKWVQRVIKVFIQPVNYFHRAAFKAELPGGETISGKGVSLYSPMKAKL